MIGMAPRLQFELIRQGKANGTNYIIVAGRWWKDDVEYGAQQQVARTTMPSSYDTGWESVMLVEAFQKVHNEYMKWLKEQDDGG